MNDHQKAIVLIADAVPDNLLWLSSLLHEYYDVKLAADGHAVLRIAQEVPRPDLLLIDAALPEIDGSELCRQLKRNPDTAAIPVLLAIPQGHAADEQHSFAAGAADVLHTPLVPETVLARVANHLQLCRSAELLRHQRLHLEELVSETTQELTQMIDAVVWAMASLAETRDYETANHLRRIQHYITVLARQLQNHPRFSHELSARNIGFLYQAAPLHDIGKVGIPDAILLKPGPLTDEEFAQMKLHTVYGRNAIADVEQHLGFSNNFLRFAREIAYSHQEKYDGSGYPQGLEGAAIPVSARLMAVADVYDALISKRVYKPAFTHETAIELIRQGSGEHFDPDVVDAMLMVEEQFMAIAAEFQDPC
ncbi:HD domain-containing protein [Duganella sp. FT92W]|uniref:HD domain-containing protein n=1 Tax=Pseudoduganella rivuli TaxID=2666085 RepID=A0A7X2IJX5_9BURK|nr:HD domain-containing phosphohydrolase [Pseudoduganella rivuli]MRV71201.1 HD domain-containing protein [Pseudoduganella rivuli]